MKRFTETAKWSDPWFQDLIGDHKLTWLYLCDQCDSSGVWKVNERLASFQLGHEINLQRVLELFGKRIHVLSPEKWFLTSFVKFQYGELSEECRPHRPILELVRRHGLERVLKDYQIPTGMDKEQDKEKEKDKTSVLKGESEGKSFPDVLDTLEFRAEWAKWCKFRVEIKKKLTEEGERASLKKLASMGLERAIQIINFTIEKQWQGLAYEMENTYGQRTNHSGRGNQETRTRSKSAEVESGAISVRVLNDPIPNADAANPNGSGTRTGQN